MCYLPLPYPKYTFIACINKFWALKDIRLLTQYVDVLKDKSTSFCMSFLANYEIIS